MKSVLLAACLLCAPALAQDGAPAPDPQAHAKREIGVVIEAFRTAIIDKDKPKFLALFPASGPVAWQSVIGDANLRRLRLTKPGIGKANYNAKYNHVSFIDGIVEDKARTEETFDNIRIETDGEIASVIFDYRFLGDGKESNRGQEAWHLVRTDAGWKIVSVIWSMHWPVTPAS